MKVFKNRCLASLDLGSNSLLLLVARRDETGSFRVLGERMETPRIGEGLYQTGLISDAALKRTCDAIVKLKNSGEAMGAHEFFLTATAAVREASNQSEVLATIKSETALAPQVLEASEESRRTYLSVTFEEMNQEIPSLVLDVGGASTEVTWGLSNRFDGFRSLKVGTVTLLEQFFTEPHYSQTQIEQARDFLKSLFRRIPPLGSFEKHYGTAGSFTQLASMDLQLSHRDAQKISQHELNRKGVENWIDKLSQMSLQDIKAIPGIDPNRADLILPGALIIQTCMDKFSIPQFSVRDRGVRFGTLFDQVRDIVPPIVFP